MVFQSFITLMEKVQNEITHKKGIPDGVSKTYYENGKLKVELPYKNGIEVGIQKDYYENGN